ncbi:MAG TPA: cupredoxin domain-containing protein [Miltoncostaeaceae bacterium]|nr:cupredoxin domain-containing protein [Miltoncostaeaceae bacterium]
MTTRTMITATIGAAALIAGAAPVLGQMTHPGGAAGGEHAVTINDAGYSPAEMVVAPGQNVVFTSTGVNPHTVTSDTGAFDSGTLNKNGRFELAAPAATGVYSYHCTFHAFMRGTVTVSTLTLTGPKQLGVGKAATVRGTAPGTPPGTPVTLERLTGAAWAPIATTTLAADGTYTFTTPKLTGSAELRTVAGTEVSPTLAIPVAPKVVAKKTPKVKLTLTVTVTPKAGGKANLERINLNTFKWSKVKAVTIPKSGKATVKVPKAGRYRVTLLAGKSLAQASSAAISFN